MHADAPFPVVVDPNTGTAAFPWRGNWVFDTREGTKLEIYLDVCNVLDRVSHGFSVVHQQRILGSGVVNETPTA